MAAEAARALWASGREGKSRMLDELCEDYEYEPKYAIKLLSGGVPVCLGRVHRASGARERQYEMIEPVRSRP
jgi:hypothetical protein